MVNIQNKARAFCTADDKLDPLTLK